MHAYAQDSIRFLRIIDQFSGRPEGAGMPKSLGSFCVFPSLRSFFRSRPLADEKRREGGLYQCHCWLAGFRRARWCATVATACIAIPKAVCSAPTSSCSCDIYSDVSVRARCVSLLSHVRVELAYINDYET